MKTYIVPMEPIPDGTRVLVPITDKVFVRYYDIEKLDDKPILEASWQCKIDVEE